jgi:hypothetical protein
MTEPARTITHGLGAALGGLIAAQLEEVERAHRVALADQREQIAQAIEAKYAKVIHGWQEPLFIEAADIVRQFDPLNELPGGAA